MDETWKAIAVPDSEEFHLYAFGDLDEADDVHDLDRTRRMAEDAARYFDLPGAASLLEVQRAEMSDETLERLKALGYVFE